MRASMLADGTTSCPKCNLVETAGLTCIINVKNSNLMAIADYFLIKT